MIGKRFREYFTFTKKERNGIIVLLFLLLGLIGVRIYQNNISFGEIEFMDADFLEDIEKFEKSMVPKINKEKNFEYFNERDEIKTEPVELFYFDPNKASRAEFKKLGLSDKQIEVLCNYRERGGVFSSKEDLLKIYGIQQKQFDLIKPYILIEENIYPEEIKLETRELVEINSASIEDLIKLSGVGNSFAERIIKYRNLLGGYYEKDQILEVYGMDSTRYLGFFQELCIDTNLIIQINLNEADFKTLIRHPYLNKYQTEAILKYRELKINFSSIEQIYQNKLLTKDEYLRLKPYLKLK